MDRFTRAINQAQGKRPIAQLEGLSAEAYGDNWIDVPESAFVENGIIVGQESSPVAKAYSHLRTKLLRVMAANQWRSIGVSRVSPSSERSTTAANLAIAMASKQSHSVLLIDANPVTGGISHLFDLESKVLLPDILNAAVKFEDGIIYPGIQNLGLILNNESYIENSDYVANQRIKQLVDNIIKRNEDVIVIVDLPCIFEDGDIAATVIEQLDAALLVVESGETTRDSLGACMELLKGVEIAGVVLDGTDDMVS